jgi:hypothetical protein
MGPAQEIDALLARFLAGQPFMEFWRTFMNYLESFDDSVLPAEQRARFEELYEMVYMGQAGTPTDEDRKVGLRGEDELRAALRDFRLSGDVETPA